MLFASINAWTSETATVSPWTSQEDLVNEAAKHVMMAKAQRELFNLKKQQAFEDKDKPVDERVFTFVADYSQNMYLPNFAGSQPGETYYYSPVNGYCFGVVDASCQPSQLNAHIYLEDVGKKGGDNVASMLWSQLKIKGLIPEDNSKPATAAKELNLVFDNCGGQNKNNMVLRMLLLLVKRGIAKIARAIFLVRGHTKNDCDRMFNQMKKIYRKSNIYSVEGLMTAVGVHPDVQPLQVLEFFDFDRVENVYLRKLTEVNANHIFEVSDLDSNSMSLFEYNGAEPKQKALVKKPHLHTDWIDEAVGDLFGKPKDIVGLQDIKWIELYDKWRRLIPVEERTFRYIKEDPGPERRAKVKKHTGEAKKQRQDRSRTGATKEDEPLDKEDDPFGGTQPVVAAVANTPQKI